MQLGLPWGAKPRLILAHLNAETLRQDSPTIEVESSLSAFVQRIRGFQHGREIRAFKGQLSRLSVSVVRLAATLGDGAFQINGQLIHKLELWPDLDERQLSVSTYITRLTDCRDSFHGGVSECLVA